MSSLDGLMVNQLCLMPGNPPRMYALGVEPSNDSFNARLCHESHSKHLELLVPRCPPNRSILP